METFTTKSLSLQLGWLASIAWTLVIAYLLFQGLNSDKQRIMDMAYAEARANINKDKSFRRWATEHGGVYVPITDIQKPVPWLNHVPGRDVTLADGRELTLLNPASALRQIMDRYASDYGVRGRITGLKFLNPDNAPDAWEKAQLELFTQGLVKEVWSESEIEGQPYLRYLRAMYMEPGCGKCHAILGYKLGDMRGATGINLPLEPYLKQIEASRRDFLHSYGLIWVLGIVGIVWSSLAASKRGEKLRLYANIFARNGEAILVTDKNNRIVDVNTSFTALTGYSLSEVIGKNPRVLASGKTSQESFQAMWTSLNSTGFWQGELWDRRKDGTIYPKWTAISVIRDNQQAVNHYIASFTDISERKAAEQRIDHLARHDALTGLVNRFDMEGRMEQSLLLAQRSNQTVAVMLIDLDRFKIINDTLGHHVGDSMLIEVANRLKSSVRESDVVSRLGGDEFVVVLTSLESVGDAASVADKILRQIGEPFKIETNILHTTPSIGISVYPSDGTDGVSLLKNADTAMYHAKNSGRNNIQFFTAEMNATATERLILERDLRAALEAGQIEVHYQPQICSEDGSVCGVEALARWYHPDRGMISPVKFIPIAEESGLIKALGSWVLNEACRQAAVWKAEGIIDFRVAVNLSVHQLRSSSLVDSIQDTLLQHGLNGRDLEIEITESVAMEDPQRAIVKLQALRQLGVHLSIDDFGTGYSSLAYLKMLPIQNLKLDRAFVRDIETDPNDASISAATLTLAHSLGLKVIAEGVETEAQQKFLVDHKCDVLQGYLFGKPETASALSEHWKINPGLVHRAD